MRDHKTLNAWIEAHRVVNFVFDFCETSWRPQARAAFDQLQRASLSVQLNIAEGYARRHPKPFLNHLQIAYGSAVETTELIELLQLRRVVSDEPAQHALEASRRCQRLLLGLIKRIRARITDQSVAT
jgi:four helix bundle protein